VAVGLVPGDLLGVGAGHHHQHRVVSVKDAEADVVDLDGDGLAGLWQTDVHALAADLKRAA
jgi:hypothetical protein